MMMKSLRRFWISLAMIAALLLPLLATNALQAQDAAGGGASSDGSGMISLDFESLKQYWNAGGTLMWFLLATSIIGVAFTAERLFRLRRSSVVPAGLSDRCDALWKKGDYEGVRKAALESKSTLGRIIGFVAKHRRRPIAELNQYCAELAIRELRPHFRRAYPLLVVATVSPLLGLLGTVVGMMEAFQTFTLLSEQGPGVFAGSISKALITTIVGLIVAIPALVAYHFFKSRANRLGDDLEVEVSDLMGEWLMGDFGETSPALAPPTVAAVATPATA